LKTTAKITFFIAVLCFLLISSCGHRNRAWKEICQEKGFNTMTDMLLPEMIESGHSFSETFSISGKNRFACIHGTEFGYGTFTDDFKFKYEPIVKGFADDAVGRLGTDENGKIMWGKQGYRGFLAVDAETKDTVTFAPKEIDADGHVMSYTVFRAYLTELPGKILLFNTLEGAYNMLYDFANKKNLFISPANDETQEIISVCKLHKTFYLLETGNLVSKWCLADLTTQGFTNIKTNKLTDLLTKKAISLSQWTRSGPFCAENRMLIGRIKSADNTIHVVACWDNKFENVSIEPLVLQCPADYNFSTKDWTFSPDGKWLYNTARKFTHSGMGDPELVFYHIDSLYPQHISPPVFAGKLNGVDVDGCFVDHSKLGMVFLDIQTNPSYVLVYKMSDMLPIIAKKLAQK
jgi:hypothetical protein